MKLGYMSTVLLAVLLPLLASAVPLHEVTDNEVLGRSSGNDDGNWKLVMKIIDDCSEQDMASCMGVKLVAGLERAARMASIDVIGGVSFVKTGLDADDGGRALSEAELTNSLEQEPAQKTSRLIDLLLEAAAKFLRTHSLQFKLPQAVPEQIQRALDEGRGKKKLLKSLLPILLGVGAKLLLLIPAGIGLVGLIAAKALLVSKLALLIAGAIAIQKLVSGGGLGSLGGKNGWSSGGSGGGGGWSSGGASSGGTGGWSSSGSGGSGGWYRSLDGVVDAHDMAYKAQAPQPEENNASSQ